MIIRSRKTYYTFFRTDTFLSAVWLLLMVIFAVFGPFITGENGSRGILPFNADKLHPSASFLPPFSTIEPDGRVFYLGSDHLGRDLLSGIVTGARSSMLVALAAMTLASVLGTLLGGLAGFFGDRQIIISRAAWMAGGIHLLLVWFYLIYVPRYTWQDLPDAGLFGSLQFLLQILLFWLCILIITYALLVLFRYIPWFRKGLPLPIDTWSTGFTEIFASVPRLFLVLSLVAVVKPGVWTFVLLMGATSWIGAARLVRGQMLRIRRQEYIEAAYALGISRRKIWLRHALPNSAAVVLVDFTFGVAAILMAESTLSFLGVGLPPEVTSWGKLLSNIKYDAAAWWLVVFPGLTIFLTILSIHTLGDAVRKKINPREIA
ncbi:ABC transporter permease [Roseivirga sp. BDSF3-8]|uniref:ABC transporter permease n=1 Tax=Roseivirga sp. BDSF3-8 TaxID=3241598 RepID=UPI003531D2CF